jgi:hypothetical protein
MRPFLLAASAAALLVACPEPGQYEGNIRVNPVANQALLLPGHGRRGAPAPAASASASAAPAAPTSPPHPARVHEMKPGDQLAGPAATGATGDVMIENDEVVFVVQRVTAADGGAPPAAGGDVVDAADARVRQDELGLVRADFGASGQAIYDSLDFGVDASGTAWIDTTGRIGSSAGSVRVETRYALAAPDRALLVTTTVRNAGEGRVSLSFGDAVDWASARRVVPGQPLGFEGHATGPYVGAVGASTSYGLTSTDFTVDATSTGASTRTVQRSSVELAPGAIDSYARVIVVGMRGDLASIVAELAHAAGEPLGGLQVVAVDKSGHAVAPPEGAEVVLATPAGADVLSIRASPGGGPLGGEVPPGTYLVRFRGAAGAPQQVTVQASAVSRVGLAYP